jgi:hypothetical protein
MKKNSVFVTFVAVVLIAFACNTSAPKTEKNESMQEVPAIETAHDYYTCTMHPEIHNHEAGLCPICGMDLIKVEAVMSDSSIVN